LRIKQKTQNILSYQIVKRYLVESSGYPVLDKTSIDSVIGVVQESIDRYGKMEEVLTDRGFVFYSWHGINRFERYLETEGIHHTHSRPHHPQTLGKVEAVNKQIQKELIHRERFRKRTKKAEDPGQKAKLDRLDFIIRNHQLETDEKSLKRGRKCIVLRNFAGQAERADGS